MLRTWNFITEIHHNYASQVEEIFFIFFKHKKLFWMLKSLEMGIVDNNLFKTIFTFFVRQTETIYDTYFTVLIKCMKNSLC